LASNGDNVIGIEIDSAQRNKIINGDSPFHESGITSILRNVRENGKLIVLEKIPADLNAKYFVICTGTSLIELENYLEKTKETINAIETCNTLEKLIVLRSSVPVGTTEKLRKFINDPNLSRLAYCPERTIEGNALKELAELPQLIGSDDHEDSRLAIEFFENRGIKTILMQNSQDSEFAKLMANVFRDLNFAITNEFAYLAHSYGVNYLDAREKAMIGYERLSGLAQPGPSSGPCLRKDGILLMNQEFSKNSLISIAQSKNNLILDWIERVILTLQQNHSIKKVLILGLAFKGRPLTSDSRMSFAFDIESRLKERFSFLEIQKFPTHVLSPEFNHDNRNAKLSLERDLAEADLLILQNNDAFFSTDEFETMRIRPNTKWCIDLWNQLKNKNKVFTFGDGSIL
jgi:UDP-N-acetyl-D-mannosaminuronic acid dehydrogenase